MTISRYTIKVVSERLEFSGTPDEINDAARIHAPYADGWRFVSQYKTFSGSLTERYEREVSRDTKQAGDDD